MYKETLCQEMFCLQSSVLQLLLKELPAATGSVSVFGDVSYACQEAWLFPSTVRENILFGVPYDPEKYKRVCITNAFEMYYECITNACILEDTNYN